MKEFKGFKVSGILFDKCYYFERKKKRERWVLLYVKSFIIFVFEWFLEVIGF